MRKKLLPLFALVSALMMHGVGLAQSTFATDIEISEQASVALTNYQVHLTINTQGLITQGKMNSDGSDLRFYTDGCLTVPLSHWVETGMNTTSTEVWVLIPSIPANAVTTIFMGYGDPLATDASNFAATFPLAMISGGVPMNLTGVVTTDWFQLDAGDLLTVGSGAPLTINARKIIINGTVNGNSAGYAGGVPAGAGQAGAGPGGGTPSNPLNSGCGGGSYGGVGGTGGFDAGDTPGVGGAIYGTDAGTDIDMGSGGGASDLSFGGAGGGALSLTAEFVIITGTIEMNGGLAQQPGSGRGGGGGAGGGVLVTATDLSFSGTISANGGGGSIGTSTANDDGGSGAGGRVKLMYSGSVFISGSVSVIGGAVGTFGTGGPPTVGGTGTYFDGFFITLDDLVISINTENAPQVVSLGSDDVICNHESITLDAGAGFSSYVWSTAETTQTITIDGSVVGVGTDTYSVVAADANGCESTASVTIEVQDCAGLVDNEFAQLFEVYPNPTSEELFVTVELVNEMPTALFITDMSGKRVYTHGNFNSGMTQTINVSALQAGTYFVEIANANGRATRMIVKN